MARNKPKQLPRSWYDRRFLGGGLVGLVLAAGSIALYQCSPSSSLPVLPSNPASQPGSQMTSTQPAKEVPEPQIPVVYERNDLSAMRAVTMQIRDRTFSVWVAETDLQRQYSLMQVLRAELTDNQGMLFVFDQDQASGFWMKDTLIPLDIAFIRSDGMVVDIQQMAPQSLAIHDPAMPYRFALEVNEGVFRQIGLGPSQQINIPADALNQP